MPIISTIQSHTPAFYKIGLQCVIGLIAFLFSVQLSAQSDIDIMLKEYNNRTVPYISVQALREDASKYLLLDTRKKEEYLVSHLPNAVWAGEEVNATFAKVYPNKSQPIVVYCSVGVRSEDFGESLKALGYTNVKNLYGSIFTWKDKGNSVYNRNEKVTDSIHVFSEQWGKYLNTGIKVH
jgi:rhodanese-related sulfurtransferase